MARATLRTKLSLDRFAQIVGLHPLHLNQVTVADLAPARTCDSPLIQYSWQDADRVGRDEIAQAIYDAETDIEDYLGFRLLPSWEVSEGVQFARPAPPELYNVSGLSVRGQWQAVKAEWGYAITGGVESKTLIDADAAVVYSDSDSDGYSETATIAVATTVTDEEEIAIYHDGHGGEDEWEIRPIKVSIAAGVATITCRREQLVLEDLWEALTPMGVDGLDDGNFLTTVAVYRHWNDPSQQVMFIWDDPELVGTFATQYGCTTVQHARQSWFICQPADWNAVTEVYDSTCFSEYRQPDRGLLWYRAGWRDSKSPYLYTRLDAKWERAIAFFALSKLDRPICGCHSLSNFTFHWAEDLSLTKSGQSGSSSYTISQRRLDNPFGTTRGAINAYETIWKYKIGESATMRW